MILAIDPDGIIRLMSDWSLRYNIGSDWTIIKRFEMPKMGRKTHTTKLDEYIQVQRETKEKLEKEIKEREKNIKLLEALKQEAEKHAKKK